MIRTKPLMRQAEDWHGMLRIVGQVLIEVRQGVWVSRHGVVCGSQLITNRLPPELEEVNNEEGADVVGQTLQVAFPIAGLPEPEADCVLVPAVERLSPTRRLRLACAEGREGVGPALQVQLPELSQVRPDDKVGVDKDHP
eukprot:CAMPEP_0180812348 /NCGR_PEP_ID=MMETSP1038_2-20121128/65947_1 /TAXON_ID=632150 /ORGANISM="Azadinium spinosum, Strain 3D9" /LENGTH=139 /DNA_ID=CAMNT_0022853853 /DNA_START=119 /DNA_END=539 /DNA_ORIENTATION=-